MTATAIKSVQGRRVWDSRGQPTVEVEVVTEAGALGRAIAPAGASRGSREAIDLRDGGLSLGGKGVARAVANVNETISPALVGLKVDQQDEVDRALLSLDPSPLKSLLGGNAVVATSLAVLHAGAAAAGVPLWQACAALSGETPSIPLPEIQIFGGGAHAGRRVDVQDFMVMVPGATSFDEVMEVTAEVYRAAGARVARKAGVVGVADEGGWWPVFDHNEDALEALVRAIEDTGERPGERVVVSLDIAASEFGKEGHYRLALEDRVLGRDEMIALLGRWLETYPIASIEDPMAEDDPVGMADFTAQYGESVQIIGDDFLVTNASRVEEAANDGQCNAVLIKVNQVGTVSEAMDCFKAARRRGYGTIISARSGETEDVSISHLSVGWGAGQLKVGSFTRSERMAKWNECLRIAGNLPANAFVGGRPFARTWWGRRTQSAGQ